MVKKDCTKAKMEKYIIAVKELDQVIILIRGSPGYIKEKQPIAFIPDIKRNLKYIARIDEKCSTPDDYSPLVDAFRFARLNGPQESKKDMDLLIDVYEIYREIKSSVPQLQKLHDAEEKAYLLTNSESLLAMIKKMR
jgi:hypothetical protein